MIVSWQADALSCKILIFVMDFWATVSILSLSLPVSPAAASQPHAKKHMGRYFLTTMILLQISQFPAP